MSEEELDRNIDDLLDCDDLDFADLDESDDWCRKEQAEENDGLLEGDDDMDLDIMEASEV